MVNDKWVIRWTEYVTNSYAYGSKIKFQKDGSVRYFNRLMPPDSVLHTWFSKTVYQFHRVEPTLPLIDGESAYEITLNAAQNEEESLGDATKLMLRVVFFGRYDEEVGSIILRDKVSCFKPPITTYSYNVELINGGAASFVFKSIVLREISREEFDEDQARIKKITEDSKKGKKRRRKDKKSE